jgi:hypothetical protein
VLGVQRETAFGGRQGLAPGPPLQVDLGKHGVVVGVGRLETGCFPGGRLGLAPLLQLEQDPGHDMVGEGPVGGEPERLPGRLPSVFELTTLGQTQREKRQGHGVVRVGGQHRFQFAFGQIPTGPRDEGPGSLGRRIHRRSR